MRPVAAAVAGHAAAAAAAGEGTATGTAIAIAIAIATVTVTVAGTEEAVSEIGIGSAGEMRTTDEEGAEPAPRLMIE